MDKCLMGVGGGLARGSTNYFPLDCYVKRTKTSLKYNRTCLNVQWLNIRTYDHTVHEENQI